MAKIDATETLAEVSDTFKEILNDTKALIRTKTEKVIIALKNKALEELDPYVRAWIVKIPYDTLKTDTQAFYNEEKKIAIAKLQEVVDAGIAKIPNPEFKEDLTEFSKTEIAKLNAVTAIEDVPTTLTTVITETEAHIQGLLVHKVKEYVARLLVQVRI